jgi:cellulose synthase (UDP-forming)
VRAETLPFTQLISPTLFVLGAVYFLGPALPLSRTWARAAVFAAVWLIIGRYLIWRLFTTVLPAHGVWHEVAWVWVCFVVELLALADALILYLIFLRKSDRRAEANRHEARLHSSPPHELPSVDVYIPTHSEPLEVLEKTITGALCLEYPNFTVWVLDDGRRAWLKEFCEAKGVGYLTRPDNSHAKAGNINHALTKTSAEFFAVFDADFIPQRRFLMRTMGFFSDPRIGVVQVPHAFYNRDVMQANLMQANLTMRKSVPDDQRFFFESIMSSRDAWDAAFCCGSNSVTRRAALRTIGDALPTQSLTEDMLLSLMMLREGYITRYLCERLAVGLAPESIRAFFVQRRRWARGAMQILYLAAGPFGTRLSFAQRLFFLPTHWLTQALLLLMSIVSPLVFLWTGVSPLINVTTQSVLYYLVPMVLAVVGGIWVYAPRQYFPLAAQVLGTFQSFKVLPAVLTTLLRPFGHVFNVTPKGTAAVESGYDHGIFWTAALLMAATSVGLLINTSPDWRIVTQLSLLPMVALWSSINVIVLFLVCMLALQAPVRRTEERFAIDESVQIIGPSGALSTAVIKDISLSGAAMVVDRPIDAKIGERLRLFITEVGFVAATVIRSNDGQVGVQFDLPASTERDLLIRKLFTAGRDTRNDVGSAWSATAMMLTSIWKTRTELLPSASPATFATTDVERLPARSLVVPPQPPVIRLSDLSEARRGIAA